MSYTKREAEVSLLIADLEVLNILKKKVDELNLEITDIENRLYGLAKRGTVLNREQANSSLPMPTIRQEKRFNYDLMMKKDRLIEERLYYQKRIDKCKVIELLDDSEKELIERFIIRKEPAEKVAEAYGYSRKQIFSKVNETLNKLIKEVT